MREPAQAESGAVPENPARAVAAVVENATALARAELRLAAAEAKAWLTRAAAAVILLTLALLWTQTCLLVLALSPLFWLDKPLPNVLAMLGLALVPTLLVFVLAARELRRLKGSGNADTHDDQR